MTPEQHNKYLAWSHFAYAGLTALMGLLFSLMFGAMIFAISAEPPSRGAPPPPPAFFAIFATLFGLFYFALAVPSFIACYALLKQKRWAKTASIIAGVIAAAFFPIGTAVCVYTVWFLMSEPGKLLYDTPTKALPGPTSYADLEKGSFGAPPPPDWR